MAILDDDMNPIERMEERLGRKDSTGLGVLGPNFSGRTTLLQNFTRHTEDNRCPSIYVGPDPETSITGARSLVRTEVSLQMKREDEKEWWTAAEKVGLTGLLDRNPLTLSGGEKATLVVMTALALSPDRLYVDCTLEQMNVSLKEKVLEVLDWLAQDTELLFADNRLSEVEHDFPEFEIEAVSSPKQKYRPITSEVILPLHPEKTGTLAAKNVRFGYTDETDVLKGIDFQLDPGDVYMLVGETGAGKSTLAKLLVGVIKPDRGKIFYGGEQHIPWKKPGQFVSYHLQNPDHQFFTESLEEEIKVAPRKMNANEDETEARYTALRDAFGFSNLEGEAEPLDADAIPYSIRKRIAMAATLATARPWTILDEPTLGRPVSESPCSTY